MLKTTHILSLVEIVFQSVNGKEQKMIRIPSELYYLRKSHIISPSDEFIDFTDAEKVRAMELTNLHRKKEVEAMYPSGQVVRNELRNPRNPLLIIYLLDPEESLEKYPLPKGTNPFVGYAISFPKK